MSAYIIVQLTVIDQAKLSDYGAGRYLSLRRAAGGNRRANGPL
jgi:hypothetical protein